MQIIELTSSKPLGSDDSSGFAFVKEMLCGDDTFAINFDRIQWDSSQSCFVIVELLKCDEKQFRRGITPHTSHPSKYFSMNSQKFISLWELTQNLKAKLILVNYSEKGTKYEDQVLMMKVTSVDKNISPYVITEDKKFSRSEFSKWFRDLNAKGKQ